MEQSAIKDRLSWMRIRFRFCSRGQKDLFDRFQYALMVRVESLGPFQTGHVSSDSTPQPEHGQTDPACGVSDVVATPVSVEIYGVILPKDSVGSGNAARS